MKQKKIIVCDAIHEKGFQILRAEKDIEVIDAVHLPKDELLKIIGDSDVAIHVVQPMLMRNFSMRQRI